MDGNGRLEWQLKDGIGDLRGMGRIKNGKEIIELCACD